MKQTIMKNKKNIWNSGFLALLKDCFDTSSLISIQRLKQILNALLIKFNKTGGISKNVLFLENKLKLSLRYRYMIEKLISKGLLK